MTSKARLKPGGQPEGQNGRIRNKSVIEAQLRGEYVRAGEGPKLKSPIARKGSR